MLLQHLSPSCFSAAYEHGFALTYVLQQANRARAGGGVTSELVLLPVYTETAVRRREGRRGAPMRAPKVKQCAAKSDCFTILP